MWRKTYLLIIATVVILFGSVAAGRTITVDDDGPSDFNTIQAAIDDAVDGDTVIIQSGIYSGGGNRDIDFMGKAITVTSNGAAENCIVDCQGTEQDMHRGFIFQNDEDTNSILHGLTIINGYAEYGGGIYCTGRASPTIDGCIISGNSAYTGGGISSESSSTCSPIIKNCIIVGNRAIYDDEWWTSFSGAGGGIYICGDGVGWWDCGPTYTAYPIIRNCTIVGNIAELTGGGVYSLLSCDMTIENCIIRDNTAIKNDTDQDIGIGLIYDACNPKCRISYSNVKGGLNGIDVYYYAEWGEGNIDADPYLVNPNDGDFHIQENSPCVDSGDPNLVPSPKEKDVYGNNRILNGAVDIGAVETTGTLTPILCLSSTQVFFDANEGGSNPEAFMLSVYNCVEGSLINWEITGNCDWLNITPSNGQSSGEVDQVSLQPDILGLSRGTYSCELSVSSNVGLGSPQVVTVDLVVHGPVIDLSKHTVEFEGIEGRPNPPAQSVTLRNIGAKMLNWKIEGACSWVSFEPSSGSISDETVEIIVRCNIENLIGGTHNCVVTISDPSAENSPQSLTINLKLEDNDSILSVPSEYPTIQSAIDAAIEGQEVVVSPGTYSGQGNRDLDLMGKAITVRSIAPHNPCIVSATIIDCQGSAADQHRGFYLHRFEKSDTLIAGFTVKNGYAERGSGIYFHRSSLIILNCMVRDCIATYAGGGIGCELSEATIEQCTILNNSALVSGGGIWSKSAAVVLSKCKVSDNTASTGGGICFELTGDYPASENCIISGNSAVSGGGAYISGHSGSARIGFCTITTNQASEGGGICCKSQELMLNNSIVRSNISGTGSEIALTGPTEVGSFEATCSITYSNILQSNSSIYVTPSSTLTWLEGNIDADPIFASPGPDGLAGTTDDDLRLAPASPCIDLGDPNYVPEPNETDYEGKSRVVNNRIDMGAYEFQGIIYVDDDAPNDPAPNDVSVSDPLENGTEAHPMDSIQEGIDIAKDGHTVLVQSGRYLTSDPWSYESISLHGKNVVVSSSEPANLEITKDTIIRGAVLFSGAENPNCMLTGFKIHNYGYGGISGNHTRATISNCIISGNGPCGCTVMKDCDGTISNCLITDNTTFFSCGIFPVVFGCDGVIKNCTIANNIAGISVGTARIENCIIYNNDGPQIGVSSGGTASISYCSIQGDLEGITGDGAVSWGLGNMDTDPGFVRLGYWVNDPLELIEGDYHLKSEGWSWNQEGASWTYDYMTSPCVDAGNPGASLCQELMAVPRDPNNQWGVNLRLNMGAYGQTAQASLPPHNWALLADLDNNGTVDYTDLAEQVRMWLATENEQPGDLNRDGTINMMDFVLLAEDWLINPGLVQYPTKGTNENRGSY